MKVEILKGNDPIIAPSKSFENGIPCEEIGTMELVENKGCVVHVSKRGAQTNKLDGYEVWVNRGDWGGEELGLNLEDMAHG